MPRSVSRRSRALVVLRLNTEYRDLAERGLQFGGDPGDIGRGHPVCRRCEQLRDDRQCRQADGERRANPRPGALRPAVSFRLRCALASQPKAPSHGVALPLYYKKVRRDGCQSCGVGGGAVCWLRLALHNCERDIWITTLLKDARAFSTR